MLRHAFDFWLVRKFKAVFVSTVFGKPGLFPGKWQGPILSPVFHVNRSGTYQPPTLIPYRHKINYWMNLEQWKRIHLKAHPDTNLKLYIWYDIRNDKYNAAIFRLRYDPRPVKINYNFHRWSWLGYLMHRERTKRNEGSASTRRQLNYQLRKIFCYLFCVWKYVTDDSFQLLDFSGAFVLQESKFL